jgi:beta-glucanase (GH16 family)
MVKYLALWVLAATLACIAPVASMTLGASLRPVGQPGNCVLRFDDEFDGTTLNKNKWTTCYWWARRGGCSIDTNHELEWYQPGNVRVSHGTLTLRAEQREIRVGGKAYHYASGVVTTGPTSERSSAVRFSFKYGYVEMRAKVPRGKGLWPAFWLLPANHADRPEIDVMEIIADQPNTDKMSVHYSSSSGDSKSVTHTWIGPDLSADWHTYGLDWEPGALVWYVDGVECWRYTNDAAIPAQPMYLLANLAVGGDWPGAPDGSTPFPSDFQIAYIRVCGQAK